MTDFLGPRIDYDRGVLDEAGAGDDPIELFGSWLDDALASDILEPTAMTLATVGSDGRPHARVVLMRSYDARGVVLFTNRRSAKARDLLAHPRAALVFDWAQIDRQVRVEGAVVDVADEEVDAYYEGRDRGRKIGAWASPQSEVLADRAELDALVEAMTERFEGRPVPRPEHWGGYRVSWESVEFWQGRPSRLHDRLIFTRSESGDGWVRRRLAP